MKLLTLSGFLLVALMGLFIVVVLSLLDALRWAGVDVWQYVLDCAEQFNIIRTMSADEHD